jgi:hypothetical protein
MIRSRATGPLRPAQDAGKSTVDINKIGQRPDFT